MKKTHCKNEHLFTEENTYIRPDTGTRQCKACKRFVLKKWRINNPEARKIMINHGEN